MTKLSGVSFHDLRRTFATTAESLDLTVYTLKRLLNHIIACFLKLVASLKESPFESLKILGKTLYQWREEVVRMWRFTKNNGITEGFHRKMKLIQRRAYGFRNFENYRLRVKVLCS